MTAVLQRFLKMNSDQFGLFRCKVQHFGVLPTNWDYFLDYLKHVDINTVSDRFHFSEYVYGPLFREGVDELMTTGSLVVYCRPDYEVIRERYLKKKGDQVIDGGNLERGLENIKKILSSFDDVFDRCRVDNLKLNTEGNVENLVNEVINRWMLLRQRALDYQKIGGVGWGSIKEGIDVLVVGERPNRSEYIYRKEFWPRAFAGPGPSKDMSGVNREVVSTSSDWVFSMMRNAGISLDRWHLTNAYVSPDDDSKSTVVDEIDFLKPKFLLVMGQDARKLIIDEYNYDKRMPVVYMHHPQYLRRFHNKKCSYFSEILRGYTEGVLVKGLYEAIKM
jgi:hypothetical protein